MKKDFLFLQLSTNLLNDNYKKDVSSYYYESIYTFKNKDGYFKHKHFWELPLWIAEISGLFKDFKKDLYIIKDINKTITDLNKIDTKFILMSVLDVNKKYYLDIINNYRGNAIFLIGGYVDFKEFKHFKNVLIFNSILELSQYFKIDYVYNTDYSLFKDIKIIPRLVLSTGCLNRCKFCSVEKNLKQKTLKEVISQCLSFKDLKFKLIYINDKTFGQAGNYIYLKYAYNVIKKYNKDFRGFIIQTTAREFLKADFINNLKKLHIKIVEVGLETYNNNILKELKKPHNVKMILTAFNILKQLKIKIIFNIIIGFKNESKTTYNNTLNFLKQNQKDIYLLNIYNLALYKNTELYNEINNNDNDNNELIKEKSFYNKKELKNINYFYNNIFKLGLNILKNN